MKTQIRHSIYEFVIRLQRGSSARGLILMYHRISTVVPDPWSLCVSPTHFAEHLQLLCREFQVLPLQEFFQAQQANKLPHGAVAITFDDGYADNFHRALPLLEQYGLPATFFIPTGYLGQDREFWWDELGKYILEPTALPITLSLKINGAQFKWNLENVHVGERTADVQPWVAKRRASEPHSRLDLYHDLWRHLYPLPHKPRQQILTDLAAWLGTGITVRDNHRTMTHAELCQFARSPLVEIGGHTVRHPSLSFQPASVQWEEIQDNKRELETILNRPLQSFSYPHGDYTDEMVNLLRKAGFSHACTTEGLPVWRGNHRFQLPRYVVEDWAGAEFAERLQQWLR